MIRNSPNWTLNPSLLLPQPSPFPYTPSLHASAALKFNPRRTIASLPIRARRRRVAYDEEEEEEEEFGYNEEIAVLETYTQLNTDEILLVHAVVDDEQVEVVIFKGFSSCLTYETSSDPSRSVIPVRSVIRSVDRVRGPFDPADVKYIDRGLSLDQIKKRMHQN